MLGPATARYSHCWLVTFSLVDALSWPVVLITATEANAKATMANNQVVRFRRSSLFLDYNLPSRSAETTLSTIAKLYTNQLVIKAIPEETIAHYRIMEPIGAGGMGAVYKAYDKKLHRIVALKLLQPEFSLNKTAAAAFFRKPAPLRRLNHPHILTVYEVGEDNGKPYIAMEYVEGETLRQKIKSRALKVKETLDIAIQIAEGLAKAHEAGIIHRDLKPENLMIRRDGYAKILDFGLAKLVAQRERALAADSGQKTLIRVETESGTLMGTVNYMSPEQLLGQRVDRRCDIFSFGVVLCEMLTGLVLSLTKTNRHDARHPARRTETSDASKSELPSELHRILVKALAKAPKDRYQTVSELACGTEARQARSRTGQGCYCSGTKPTYPETS